MLLWKREQLTIVQTGSSNVSFDANVLTANRQMDISLHRNSKLSNLLYVKMCCDKIMSSGTHACLHTIICFKRGRSRWNSCE